MTGKNKPRYPGGRKRRARAAQRSAGLQKHPFVIDHIDSLGQGVCKQNGKVTFIAKTLPGETGTARIYKRSKGVQFATLESLDKESGDRSAPQCEHFAQCPGCHYQHTSYQHELAFKTEALRKISQPLFEGGYVNGDIKVFAAPERIGYRNRMQLHYRHQYIGMLNASNDQVVEIPGCKLIRPELQAGFDQLYQDKSWRDNNVGQGHCELYWNGETVKQTWNGDYAEGGFTQVNEFMNTRLKQIVTDKIISSARSVSSLLDLFSGSGNLSNPVIDKLPANTKRTMIDVMPLTHPDYIQLDLYQPDALTQLNKQAATGHFDCVLLDPPRKGFADLGRWIKKIKPRQLVYVSCNASTMVRDLRGLEGKYTIDELALVDLFPATHHFETLACVSFK